MIACLDSTPYTRGQSEDVYYVENMLKTGGMLAPRAAALRFSVESVMAPDPFGFHAPYKHLSSADMAELLAPIVYTADRAPVSK